MTAKAIEKLSKSLKALDTTLPPKPDLSGEPRPPEAPELYVWGGVRTARSMINTKWGRRAIPEPPDDWGPALEWWRATPIHKSKVGGWFALLIAAYLTFQEGGFGWAATWWMWLVVLGLPLAAVLLMNNDRPIAAGAHWLYHKRKWIRTYELDGVGIVGGLTANELILQQGGEELGVRVDNLQENPALWALVYNGIRHSVADGAQIIEDAGPKQTTRSMLQL